MKNIYNYTRNILTLLYKKRVSTFAGALAYFFILSVVPMLFLAIYIINIFSSNLDVLEIDDTFLNFEFSSSISILFIITTSYSASKFFFHLLRCGEVIYGFVDKRKPIIIRAMAVLNMLLFVFSLACFFILMTLFRSIPNRWIYISISIILLLVALFISLLFINRYVSSKRFKLFTYYKGALFTILFDTIISFGFSLYIDYFSDYTYLYSYLASIVIALLYVYLLMLGLIYGFLINARYIKIVDIVNQSV